jgi:hypothetical protein
MSAHGSSCVCVRWPVIPTTEGAHGCLLSRFLAALPLLLGSRTRAAALVRGLACEQQEWERTRGHRCLRQSHPRRSCRAAPGPASLRPSCHSGYSTGAPPRGATAASPPPRTSAAPPTRAACSSSRARYSSLSCSARTTPRCGRRVHSGGGCPATPASVAPAPAPACARRSSSTFLDPPATSTAQRGCAARQPSAAPRAASAGRRRCVESSTSTAAPSRACARPRPRTRVTRRPGGLRALQAQAASGAGPASARRPRAPCRPPRAPARSPPARTRTPAGHARLSAPLLPSLRAPSCSSCWRRGSWARLAARTKTQRARTKRSKLSSDASRSAALAGSAARRVTSPTTHSTASRAATPRAAPPRAACSAGSTCGGRGAVGTGGRPRTRRGVAAGRSAGETSTYGRKWDTCFN